MRACMCRGLSAKRHMSSAYTRYVSLQVQDLNPSSWIRGLQMVMQPINEDAKQGGTEWAALSEPNGWTLAVATLTIDPLDSKEPSYKD